MNAVDQTLPCWSDVPFPQLPMLQRDLRCDTCIIGAGIAGLTTALLLAQAGQEVIVIERESIGSGETQRTTAHLSNAIDARYYEIARIHGAEAARLTAESHTAAIAKIESITRDLGSYCDFERLDGFLFPSNSDDQEIIQKEYDAASNAGINVELVRGPAWIAANGNSLRFPRQAQFHPLKYLVALTDAVRQRGGQIFERTTAVKVKGGNEPMVETENGPSVKCAAIVVATNSPFNNLVAMHTKQAAYRTYAIATRVMNDSLPNALFWDTADPYHYVRQHSVDSAGNGQRERLLIIGGEDHKTGQSENPAHAFARLLKWANDHVPGVGPVRYAWSGQVMESIDGLAWIGRNPMDDANIYIATGDCGQGLTHGTIAGMILNELIQGREHPWAATYDPSRKPLAAIDEFANENINVAKQYGDWLTAGQVKSESEVRQNCGAIMRVGLTKQALYRDDAGRLHRLSAICPHLGCIVRWNNVENTWDCPCHGSRFDGQGRVVNGPAVKNLTVIG